MKKKIKLVLMFVIIFLLLSDYSVKAEESKYIDESGKTIKCSSKYPKLDHIKENDFKIKVKEITSSKYEFILDPQDIVKDVPITISCYDITAGNQLEKQETLVGSRGGFFLETQQGRAYECEAIGKLSYEITNSNGESILDSVGNKQECSAAFSQKFSFEVDPGPALDVGVKNCQGILNVSNTINNASQIDCNNINNDTFKKGFCEAKTNSTTAIDFGSDRTFKDYNPDFISESDKKAASGESYDKALKCDIKKQSTSGNYYVNKKYLYGYGKKVESFGSYQYHYDNPNKASKSGPEVTCGIKCEEAVTVEYGAPIASKAGMCFTYQVKVTSRVSCWMENEPKKPEIFTGYCEPIPRCFHGNTEYMQGGPNEDFDACIQKCDKGKYTKKCSEKCYKKVYGETENLKEEVQNKSTVKKMDISECTNPNKPNYTCYYVRGGNNKVNWVCPGGFNCGNQDVYEGRWYNTHWAGIGGKSNYSLCSGHNDGIYRRILGDSFCTDTCSWYAPAPGEPGSTCTTPYLNPGLAEWDNYYNMKKYNDAVNACKAKATCTTSVAYFRISAGYSNYKNNEYTEINFPYTEINGKEKDRLASGNNRTFSNIGLDNTTLIIGKTPAEREKSGCYAPIDEVKQENLYQAEWTFPGTWMNNKTGEISYRHKDSGWTEMKKAFCTPLNAKNVNQKWWNWAMKSTFNGTNTSISSNQYKEECAPYESSNSVTKIDSASNNDIEKWNINAITTDFGYFKWGIHIQCFYALNTNPAMITSNSSEDVKKCCASECCGNDCNPQGSYRIRSVDLNNLFPDPGGKQTPKEEAGRLPGFNWTENAVNMINNKDYTSNPQKYMLKVQELGNSIYSDDYLDYHFDLNKQNLSELQKNVNYGQFNGKTIERSNKMTAYYSDVIRKYTDQAPQEKPATECNNLENWRSMKCYNP